MKNGSIKRRISVNDLSPSPENQTSFCPELQVFSVVDCLEKEAFKLSVIPINEL